MQFSNDVLTSNTLSGVAMVIPADVKYSKLTPSACCRSFFASSSSTALLRAFRFLLNACRTFSVFTQNGPITMLLGMTDSRTSFSCKCDSTSCFTSAAEWLCASYVLQNQNLSVVLNILDLPIKIMGIQKHG